MLTLRTLGGLALDGDGTAPNGARLQRSRLSLLAVVAAAGRAGIARDRLLALFWPEADTERARGSLKQGIYVLRRDLGDDLFLENDNICLNPARIASDVAEFDAAFGAGDWCRAAACYHGPFLLGVHLGNGEFTRWRDDEAERLAARYRRSLELLATDAEKAGEILKAIDWRRTLAAADPLSAPVTVKLMRALVRSGDRTAALRQAAVHSQLVRCDLETEPDPTVTRLADEIRLEAAALASAIESTHEPPLPPHLAAKGATSEAPPLPPEETAKDNSAGGGNVPPARSQLRRLILGAGLAIGAAAALLAAPLRSDPDLVRIDVARGESPDLEAALAQTLRDQIQNRELSLRFGRRTGHAAQYRVAAAVRVSADSLYLTAQVTDRSGTRLRSIDPIVVASKSARIGRQQLGELAAIAIAAGRSRLLVTWAPVAAIPQTWESYQALEAALRGWQPPESGDEMGRFDRAAALDPTAGSPLVLKALSLTKSRLDAGSDSVLNSLVASRRRLGPWDRAMIDVIRAWNVGDLTEGHLASHRLLDLVPDSEWALVTAYAAIHVGRGRETLELLARVPADLAWPRFWVDVIRHQALMLTGDFTTALTEARVRLNREPENGFWQQSAVKALAALGRVEEVEAICARSLVERLAKQPCGQAVLELRGRGHPGVATRVARRFLDALKAADTTAAEYNLERAWLAYVAGDWNQLDQALAALPAALVDQDQSLLQFRVMAAAARGDRTTARTLLTRVDLSALLERAEIAALLDEKVEAVGLLTRAFRTGYSRSFSLNQFPAFDRLRGYPPYDSLVRPVDNPEHRAQFAIR